MSWWNLSPRWHFQDFPGKSPGESGRNGSLETSLNRGLDSSVGCPPRLFCGFLPSGCSRSPMWLSRRITMRTSLLDSESWQSFRHSSSCGFGRHSAHLLSAWHQIPSHWVSWTCMYWNPALARSMAFTKSINGKQINSHNLSLTFLIVKRLISSPAMSYKERIKSWRQTPRKRTQTYCN